MSDECRAELDALPIPYYILRADGKVEQALPSEAIEAMENRKNRVALTSVRFFGIEVSEVSTVFLTVDHSFGFGGPPLLFETMVFGGGCCDEIQIRTSTLEEAQSVHRRMTKRMTQRAPLDFLPACWEWARLIMRELWRRMKTKERYGKES